MAKEKQTEVRLEAKKSFFCATLLTLLLFSNSILMYVSVQQNHVIFSFFGAFSLLLTAGLGVVFLLSEKEPVVVKDLETENLEQALLSIFDHAKDYIAMTSPKGEILYHNQAFVDITGKDEEEFLASRPKDFHPDWANRKISIEASPALDRYGCWVGETAILDAQNNEVPVLQTIIFHYDDEGNIVQKSTIMKNIAELKERAAGN